LCYAPSGLKMKSSSVYSLQRTMVIYFLLIGFASVLVGVEFLSETQGVKLKEDLLSGFEHYSNKKISEDALFQPIDRLRSKAILMIVVVLLVVVIVLMMFIKNITEPLQHMIEIAQGISKGDLSQSIEIKSNNELAKLGNVINEMSSNLQEITLLSKNLCQSGDEFINQVRIILIKPTIGRLEVESLNVCLNKFNSEFKMLENVINCFNFYSLKRSSND
jgi:methyl-accepting chemotaxis protein